MSIAFHLVDAFTSVPFAGNPAAVYLLEGWPSDAWLQKVAREMNQSETAFLVKSDGRFSLRWFTPAVEVDLCGHATLASAHVLWQLNLASSDQAITFSTRSDILTARQNGADIELDFPLLPEQPVQCPSELARALGVQPKYVGQGRHDFVVEVASEKEVRSALPDFTSLAKVAPRGVILTARCSTPEFDFVSRFFAPAAGINEDPATGSAHCCLASFWQKRLGKNQFAAFQASPRGGVVNVRVDGQRAILGGRAVTVARGELLAAVSDT